MSETSYDKMPAPVRRPVAEKKATVYTKVVTLVDELRRVVDDLNTYTSDAQDLASLRR